MNVLLIGSGGREHALAWKISQSPLCGQLFCAPGNPGTALHGTNLPLQATDFEGLMRACVQHNIGLVVVGPELPLVEGLVDAFAADARVAELPVIGPSAAAARLEGSKAFAKHFMQRHGIPTAAYREFGRGELTKALEALPSFGLPVVLKADGLAAGKGVLICHTAEEARQGLEELLGGRFGDAGERVVIEAFLVGREMSVFALCDGQHYVLLPSAKDYKRIGEGDQGPNTGGMGALCPAPWANPELLERVESRILRPTLEGMRAEGHPYRGFLYIGLMICGEDPFVIEYNCRLGDPETQAVLPMLQDDLLDWMLRLHPLGLAGLSARIRPGYAATVILAAAGYPGDYARGAVITGADASDGPALVFHAGTALDASGRLVSSGGRVLAVTGYGEDAAAALEAAYGRVGGGGFEGMQYRRDIGYEVG